MSRHGVAERVDAKVGMSCRLVGGMGTTGKDSIAVMSSLKRGDTGTILITRQIKLQSYRVRFPVAVAINSPFNERK